MKRKISELENKELEEKQCLSSLKKTYQKYRVIKTFCRLRPLPENNIPGKFFLIFSFYSITRFKENNNK